MQKIKDEVEAVNSFGGKAKLVEANDININKLKYVESVDSIHSHLLYLHLLL